MQLVLFVWLIFFLPAWTVMSVCVLVCLCVWMWNVDHSKEEDWNIVLFCIYNELDNSHLKTI